MNTGPEILTYIRAVMRSYFPEADYCLLVMLPGETIGSGGPCVHMGGNLPVSSISELLTEIAGKAASGDYHGPSRLPRADQ